MATSTNVKVSSADEHPGIVLIVLLIAVVGFFIVAILYVFDGLVGDVMGDFSNFPGLKQLLTLLGTIASAFNSLISSLVNFFANSSSSSSD